MFENIKMGKLKGKETKTEQGTMQNIKIGEAKGKETNHNKE